MSEWTSAQLSRCVESLDAGVSVNAEDRPHRAGEIGVLKTSALSGCVFRPEQNKAVVQAERRLVAEPVLANSILVSRMNTPALVGESCYVEDVHETLFLPDRIWQLKLKAEVPTNVRWLSYVLQSHEYRHFVEIHATGTSASMKNLPKLALLSLPVRYPEEPEQAQIAAVLATIESTIQYSEAIVKKLKQVKRGLLHDLLTRGLDAEGVLRPSYEQAPHLYQESRIGWIPKDWTLRAVASLGEIKSGSTPSRGKADRYFHSDGTPWVKTLDLNEDVIRQTDECITVAALRESSCPVLPADSVLIAMYGGWEQIGRTGMLGVPAATNQAISAVMINDPDVVPEYVLRALQHGRPRWKRVAASTRKDPNITKVDVETFELPMPSTKDEQIAIVARFRALLTRLTVEQQELHKRQQEKAGVMDDLLTGRVRVTNLVMTSASASSNDADSILSQLCFHAYDAENLAKEEYRRELLGDQFLPELLVMREDKVRVEIRKENVSHNAAHLHITHSDKIDVSLSLLDFSILAGEIDRKTLKYFLKKLRPLREKLLAIWNELNEKENSIGAERLIKNLNL